MQLAGQAAALFLLRLGERGDAPSRAAAWRGNDVVLPQEPEGGCFADVFTRARLDARPRAGRWVLPLDEAFRDMPLALLKRL